MSCPAGLFPHTFDGVSMSAPQITKATGLNRYDIAKALQADPTISTLAALKAKVVAIKSRPARGRPTIKRSSLLWNNCDRKRG